MRRPRLLVLPLLLVCGLTAPGAASAAGVSIVPASPVVGACFPLHFSDTGFTGFMYGNVAAFSAPSGSTISFDLGRVNNVDIRRSIFLSPVDAAGRATGWTKVVDVAQTPRNPRGNTTVGDFELTFTTTAAFAFDGTTRLVVGFDPAGATPDNVCEQGLVGTTSADSSGKFVSRFFGQTSQTTTDDLSQQRTNDIGGMMIVPAVTTATVVGGQLQLDATTAPNALTATRNGAGDFSITGTSAVEIAGSGCTQTTAMEVRCTGVASAQVTTGPGADQVDLTALDVPATLTDAGGAGQTFTGGSAADALTANGADGVTLVGGPGGDTLIGGSGNDLLTGGEGSDFVDGRDGNDRLVESGTGNDAYNGGNGFDRVDSSGQAGPVTVTLDGAANDTGPLGTDNVQPDVEALTGTPQGDTLTGSGGPNTLAGSGGGDTLNGGEGNDFLGGGSPGQTETVTDDADVYNGDGGADTVTFSYMGGSNGVHVTLDGNANDGFKRGPTMNAPGTEGDNVTNTIERVNGTNANDVLDASGRTGPSGVTLVGFGGSDSLIGSEQADFLDGGLNSETNFLFCNGGVDTYRIQGSEAPSERIRCNGDTGI